jgi:Fe-S-cluster-containing dehydrogenase component
VNPERRPGVPSYHLSLACNHCAEAPCVAACPSVAIARDRATGAILVDDGRCLGCRYCSWVCPYDAPRFDVSPNGSPGDGDAAPGGMTKCTGCPSRLVAGREPACVDQCPTGALAFGPLEGAGDESVAGIPEATVGAALRVRPRGRGARAPETTWRSPSTLLTTWESGRRDPPGRISLAHEWPLLVFSIGTVGLAGTVIGGEPAPGPGPAAGFALGAVVAALAATGHLGRPARAWRAAAHVRRSWLSREVALFVAFVAATLVHLTVPTGGFSLAGVAMALGLATLVAVDRVYDPVRSEGMRPLHSADALLTGLLLAAVLRGAAGIVAALTLVKLGLYASRRVPGLVRPGAGVAARLGAVARIVLGALVPVHPPVALPLLAAAEVLDRVEFYAELEPSSPRRAAFRAAPRDEVG